MHNIILIDTITKFCGIDGIVQKIPHIQFERGEYSVKYCRSRKTLLWIWIMLCARRASEAPKVGVFPRNDWKVLGIGQLKCVSYGIICGVLYCVDTEKALIGKDDRHERALHVELRRLVIETRPEGFWNFLFSLIYARCSNYFMHFVRLLIERLIWWGLG